MRQFSELGIERVSMRSLARELGYSATALYSYYKNKDDILAAVRAIHVEKLATSLENALAWAGEENHGQLFIESYLAFVSAERAACKLTFALQQPDPAHYPALATALSRLEHAFTRLILKTSSGPISQAHAEQTGHLVWAGFHGLMALHLSGIAPVPQAKIRKLHSRLLELVNGAAEQSDGGDEKGRKRAEQMAFDL